MKLKLIPVLAIVFVLVSTVMASAATYGTYYVPSFYDYYSFPNYFKSNSVTYPVDNILFPGLGTVPGENLNTEYVIVNSSYCLLPGDSRTFYVENENLDNHTSWLVKFGKPYTDLANLPRGNSTFYATLYLNDGTIHEAKFTLNYTRQFAGIPILDQLYGISCKAYVAVDDVTMEVPQVKEPLLSTFNPLYDVRSPKPIYIDTAVQRGIPDAGWTFLGVPLNQTPLFNWIPQYYMGGTNKTLTSGIALTPVDPGGSLTIRDKPAIVATSFATYPEIVKIVFNFETASVCPTVTVTKYDWTRQQFNEGIDTVGKPYERGQDLMDYVNSAVSIVIAFFDQVMLIAGVIKFFLIDYWYATLSFVEMFAMIIALRRGRGDVFRAIIAFVSVNVTLLYFVLNMLEAIVRFIMTVAQIAYNIIKSILPF